ncbi:MAG TPA: polyhydroxyalkanoate synthesis repressor PhaR [Cycloclasticus sp.]|jgi:polyhydroxyalkanoate synthesis repressor PhaR|nr:polyhydroxyalkanoate synthesis repressor PhaR [Cycloclasticus sp.]HIL92628.1 polyhydroxyalkanoate synthesis repressor PhaR [Cycloclasticus sp.]
MSDFRIIKKYPNRRLYDTEISKYVTLNDVRQLIIDREPVKVVAAKSRDDLTRSVLLQIILEQEEEGEPIMSAEMLEQLIRFYGDPFQHNFANYLESSVKLIAEQRSKVRSKLERVADPFAMMTSLANRNMDVFKEMQDGLFKKVVSSAEEKKK